tara:strand:+ start:1249 stop:1488 length:240 start_codon:yes stop_codon:yes gene_type:complete
MNFPTRSHHVPPTTTFATTFVRWASLAVIGTLLTAAAVVFMEAALRASEHEDCHRMARHAQQGHPVTVPDWCAPYLTGE